MNKKIALFSSDPGSALAMKGIASFLQAQKIYFDFFQDSKGFIPSSLGFSRKVIEPHECSNALRLGAYSAVITGTSVASELEVAAIKAANESHIPSFSFIDHWSNYLRRFQLSEQIHLATRIAVNDEEALLAAANDGIPKERLMVLGNPFWNEIQAFKPYESRKDFFSKHQLNPDQGLIVFFSDAMLETMSSQNYKNLGYTEAQAFADIWSCYEQDVELKNKYQLVIKLHPKETQRKYSDAIRVVVEGASLDWIFYSDLCVGMFSAVLLEALLMGRKVLRYEPQTTTNYLPSWLLPQVKDSQKIDLREVIAKPLSASAPLVFKEDQFMNWLLSLQDLQNP